MLLAVLLCVLKLCGLNLSSDITKNGVLKFSFLFILLLYDFHEEKSKSFDLHSCYIIRTPEHYFY